MKFILYCRKSTDTDDKQVLSLDSQESELMELAKRENLEVIEVLKESKSAKAPGRPVFAEMMKKIDKGEADAILCWKIDRLTRNPVDGGQIQWLLQNGKIKCIRTFEKSYYPNDNVLLMSIEQAMASQYIRDLSSNVKRGNRAKMEKGEWPNHAPFGYFNDKATKTIKVNKKTAPYVVRAFELYATGGNTLEQITQILFGEGLRTRTGNKVFKNHIHRIVTSKFYVGLMERDEKLYQGNHKPLITQNLYEKVQNVLNGKLHPKPKTHFYSARGFLTCASCGCMLTAETQKGHKYYHCTNGKGNCDEKKKYLKNDDVDLMLANMFKVLQIDEEFIELSGEAYRIKNKDIVDYTQSSLDALQNELNALTDKESALVDGFIYPNSFQRIFTSRKNLILKTRELRLKSRLPILKLKLEELLSLSNKSKKSLQTAIEPQKSIWKLMSLRKGECLKNYFRTPLFKMEMWLNINSKVLIPYWQV